MKNILLLLLAVFSPLFSFAQIDTDSPDNFQPPQQYNNQNTETVYLLDSAHYWRYNSEDTLWYMGERNTYDYDSLGRNSSKLTNYFSSDSEPASTNRVDYQYSQSEDNQTVFTWENGDWVRTHRTTFQYNDNRSLDFIRTRTRDSYTNQWRDANLEYHRYRDADLRVDTIQNYRWDTQEDQWMLSSFRHNYYSERLDSVHWLRGSSVPEGRPDTRLFYEYTDGGQERKYQELIWDDDDEIYFTKRSREYFYGPNSTVDSAHFYLLQWVIDDFLTFQYNTLDENGWVIADTTYMWFKTLTEPQIYQVRHYRYDEYGNRVEYNFYQSANFEGGYPLIHYYRNHFFYSPREIVTTSLPAAPADSPLECHFANPYSLGQPIRCFNEQGQNLQARLYDAQGQLRMETALGRAQTQDFSIDTPLFPGMYFLLLTDGDQILGRHKLLIVE